MLAFISPLITYEANALGLRSPELSEPADIAIVGCSYSYGVGVPENMSWGVQVANHFNLPYITVAGIIDSDKVTNSGLLPFFLKTGFEGVVPAGTPIVQIFPFKREDWEMEYKFYTPEEIFEQTRENSLKFRDPNGGVYKRDYWEKRKYK